MSVLHSSSARIGLAGGALFFLNGLIDGSRSYPFIWPTLAGALAFWVATRSTQPHRIRHGLMAALTAGCVAGVIGFIGASVMLLVGGRVELRAIQASAGPGARTGIALAGEIGIAAACLLAVVAALVGGALMIPARWVRPPGSATPAA